MAKLVTVGIPVYKRLTYFPQALRSVAAQDYPAIELIVSDNGQNGAKIPEIVDRWYHRPYRFRHNPSTVEPSAHFNQVVNEASGEYVVLLGDDDEISPNFSSELVRLLEKYPYATAAIPRQEAMDEAGRTLRSSSDKVPEILSGEDFIRGWCLYTYGFLTFSTVLWRTAEVKKCGGYPIIPTSNGDEDLLMVKLALGNHVAFGSNAVIRKRQCETSLGYSCDYTELVEAMKCFMGLLNRDPVIQRFAEREPRHWAEIKGLLVKMCWETCYYRWREMYQKRLPALKWMASAFTMPYIPAYYSAVTSVIVEKLKSAFFSRAKELLPWAYNIYRALKHGPNRG